MSITDYGSVSPQFPTTDDVVSGDVVMGSYPNLKSIKQSGHKVPDSPPRIQYAILYELAKGYGIHRSIKRMSNFYLSDKTIDDILNRYVDIRENNPSGGKYRDLMDAVADYHGINYEYEKTEKGHMLKMWGEDEREWQFPISRGKNRYRKMEGKLYEDAVEKDRLADESALEYDEILDKISEGGDLSGLKKRLKGDGDND